MRVDIWHHVLWSRYKAVVFSALGQLSNPDTLEFRFFQIADTARAQARLTPVDRTVHKYPYRLLFEGVYEEIPKWKLLAKIFVTTFLSDAHLVVIPGFGASEFWIQAFAARLRGKKIAIFCDSTLFDNRQTAIRRTLKWIFLRSCNATFCYGKRSTDFLRWYGVPDRKIIVRCQAAALPADYSAQHVFHRRVNQASSQRPPAFLYVGRLSREKNVGLLVQAIYLIRKIYPTARLDIVGSGPLERELKQMAEQLSLGDSINFNGPLSEIDLATKYLSATCLVLPSRSEPWGVVVNEALSYGCPAVVSERCGCTPELVVERVSGLTFRSGDVQDLANKLLVVLNEMRNHEMVAKACQSIVSRFTPQNSARQIYEGCLRIFEENL